MKSKKPKDLDKIFADGRLIDKAIKLAACEAFLMHKRLGHPIVVWRNGKVVLLPPEQIHIPRAFRKLLRHQKQPL